MKKIIAMTLAALTLVLCLAGCGAKETAKELTASDLVVEMMDDYFAYLDDASQNHCCIQYFTPVAESETNNADGTVTVSWDTPAGAPSGGWYVSYNTVGSMHPAYMPDSESNTVTGSSVTLEGLVPDAEYEVTLSLTAADASSTVFGQSTVAVKTPACEAFTDYGITPTPPYGTNSSLVSLWLEPNKTDWTYFDLNDHRTSFSATDKIAVCIEVNAVNQSDDTVTLLYALRDASGNVVNDVSRDLTWDNLWYNRRHANAIPLPAGQGEASAPGSYTLEIYINGKLLASTGFTIA